MATLIRKKIRGNEYFYVVEIQRVNGKPRYVNQKYIGPVDKVLEQMKNMAPSSGGITLPAPLHSVVLQFGAVAALYDLAMRLKVVERLDACIGKRHQGLSTGMYLLIAAINRAVAPMSKVRIGEWFSKTILSRLISIPHDALSSQRFWDNMDVVEDAALRKFEDEFVKYVCETYHLSTRCLIYDATNFFTYIDSANPAQLPKRGHSKEKRSDLKIVSLALMVSPDNNVPLLYETYPGNRPDATQFSQIQTQLRQRYLQITGQSPDITLVFDKGNNSPENIQRLSEGETPLHFVGSLRLCQVKDVLKIPLSDYRQLNGNRFASAKVYRTHKHIYGREFVVLAVFNQALYDSQMEGIEHNIAKCFERLKELQDRLRRRETGKTVKGRKPTVDNEKSQVKSILGAEYMSRIFDVTMEAGDGGEIRMEYVYNPEKLKEIKDTLLGKTILFTDRKDWTEEEIVGSYRSAYHVEDAFRQMKNTNYLDFRPIRHWTDQKIRVHAFYCVLAYRLCCILQKELADKGIVLCISSMLDKLCDIEQVINIYAKQGQKHPQNYALTQMNETTKKIFDALNINKYELVR
jgi:transposase